MEKFNFSNEGFQNLQKHLYAKTDQLLEKEAAGILANFRKWMVRKFILSDEQIAFMYSQDLIVIKLLTALTYIAISNRLPIKLVKPALKPNALQLDSKLIRPESNFTTLLSGKNKTAISGNLVIHISYTNKGNRGFIPNVYQNYNQQYLNQTFLAVFSMQ